MNWLKFLLIPVVLLAQVQRDPSVVDIKNAEIEKINLKDGSTLVGKIISEDENSIIIQTNSGIKSEIQKVEIKKRRNVTDKLVEGEVWNADPNKTRLFFSPTGRALPKGEGYFSVYELFLPFVAVGVTDNLTLAGGFSLFPGSDSQLLYVAPKYTFLKKDNTNLSAGLLYMKLPSVSEGAGIVYAVGTFGGYDKAATIGIGYGFAGDEFAHNPLLTLGGEIRVSQHLKLISENWILPGGESNLLSAGVRFFGEKLAVDFGFMSPLSENIFIPWLGFSYNF